MTNRTRNLSILAIVLLLLGGGLSLRWFRRLI